MPIGHGISSRFTAGTALMLALLAPGSRECRADEALASFCTDPVATICHKDDDAVSFSPSDEALPSVRIEDYVGRMSKGQYNDLKEMENRTVEPSFDLVKQKLGDAIDSSDWIDAKSRKLLKERVSGAELTTITALPDMKKRLVEASHALPPGSVLRQLMARKITETQVDPEMLMPIEKKWFDMYSWVVEFAAISGDSCGEANPINAYSLKTDDRARVGVCLGSELRLQKFDVERRYPVLTAVLAHELGHQIGSRQRPQLYERYLRCVTEKYAHREHMTLSAADSRLEPWESELVADFWAATVIGNVIRSRAEVLGEPLVERSERARRFVKHALSFLCSTTEAADHPSGATRISSVFATNASLRRAFGCPVNVETTCGGAGSVRK